MGKTYSFPTQAASEECPAVPRSIRVYGETLADATGKLARALKDDPQLEQTHRDFDPPDQKSTRGQSRKEATRKG